jgi:hypothetical protein
MSTQQASKPFSRLEQPRPRSPEYPQPLSSSPTSSPPTRHAHFNPMSPESRIAIARARATIQPKPRAQPLGKLGHPTIGPTAFSPRHTHSEASQRNELQIPSSPPLTNGNEASIPIVTRVGSPSPPAKKRRKPAKPRQLPRTPMQLSSPPGSPLVLNTAAKKLREGRGKYGGLTSSVVKGEAANGLLELMRGAVDIRRVLMMQ